MTTLIRGITEAISVHNELDILEAHLEEHKNLVQRTIISESRTDVAGRPKPLYVRDSLSRFDRFDIELVEYPAHLNKVMPTPDIAKPFQTIRTNDAKRKAWNHTQHNINTTWVLNIDVDEILNQKHFDEWVPALLDSDLQKACITMKQYIHQVDCRSISREAWRFFRSELSEKQMSAMAHKKMRRRKLKCDDGSNIGWHFTNCAASAKEVWEKAKTRPWLFKVDRSEDVPGIEYFESLMGKQVHFLKYPATPLPKWKKEDPERLPVWMAANLDKFPTISDAL